MSRERLSAIAHAGLPFAAPWSESTAAEIVAALTLEPQSRVIDLGCGWAEFVTRLVERYDVRAEGVERSAYALARARVDTLPRAGDRLTLHHSDVADLPLPAAAYDLVICVGSSHLYDGLAGTFEEAVRLLRPGGRILLGDGVWTAAPTDAALAGLGAEPGDVPALDDALALAAAFGLVVERTWQSSPAEWDHYEDSWCESVDGWAGAHPDDPDAAAALALAAEHRRGYRQGYRGMLGFLTALLSPGADTERLHR